MLALSSWKILVALLVVVCVCAGGAEAHMDSRKLMEIHTRHHKSLYELLGISRQAAPDVIKRAYRKKSKLHHPDKAQNSKSATAMFRDLADAKDILLDPTLRRRYDHLSTYGREPEDLPMDWSFGVNDTRYPAHYGAQHSVYSVAVVAAILVSLIQYFTAYVRYHNRHNAVRNSLQFKSARKKRLDRQAAEEAHEEMKRKAMLRGRGKRAKRKMMQELKEHQEAQEQQEETEDSDVSGSGMDDDADEGMFDNDDDGTGFQWSLGGIAKPRLQDVFIVRIVLLPYTLVMWMLGKGESAAEHLAATKGLTIEEAQNIIAREEYVRKVRSGEIPMPKMKRPSNRKLRKMAAQNQHCADC